jgi:hypothetical protein
VRWRDVVAGVEDMAACPGWKEFSDGVLFGSKDDDSCVAFEADERSDGVVVSSPCNEDSTG